MDEAAVTHIVFHSGCVDGRTAAWLLQRCTLGPHQLHPYRHGDPAPVIDHGDVWVADIAFPYEVLCAWAQHGGSVVVLDHHVTAAGMLAAVNEPLETTLGRIDDPDWRGVTVSVVQEFSGAGLAAVVAERRGVEVPTWVLDVQDRDLWLWLRPGSREVCSGLDEILFAESSQPAEDADPVAIELAAVARFDLVAAAGRDLLQERGAVLVEAFDQHAEELCDNAEMVVVAGHSVPFAKVDHPKFGSRVGHRLLERHADAGFSGYWFVAEDTGAVRVGLRSSDERMDVAQIAQLFGGGGHRNASGFTCASLQALADTGTPGNSI